jgi:hypothetical protein
MAERVTTGVVDMLPQNPYEKPTLKDKSIRKDSANLETVIQKKSTHLEIAGETESVENHIGWAPGWIIHRI